MAHRMFALYESIYSLSFLHSCVIVSESAESSDEPDSRNERETSNLKTRKRLLKPENHKKNIRKLKRMRGEEYTSAKGKIMPAKILNAEKICGCL